MADEILELRRMAPGRRIQVNSRAMDSQRKGCRVFPEVAVSNDDRARWSWPWELAQAKCKEGEPIRTESGDIADEPPSRGPDSSFFIPTPGRELG